ncbi:hypothetical protein CANCADRAFT_58688 [Tortispora caseinolytica NRRL Y-17796]|uniref:Uncharacterized protein n=1 Tax=Tortispora caseinolytica NRRL Y-17796 TaxID=767744 RepID=A0A1E4T9C0_9ASCO|nr:hypothetical protein CANCADRAFT_58688 [Tortispora caseinolytica NRRL Y-17796]
MAMRSLVVSLGRAGLIYATREPLITEKFPIPAINFRVVIRPSMTTVMPDMANVGEENIAWGAFHSGVAAGLSISPDAKNVTGNWIVFNKPAELNPRHGGFLLGLGLNGHLKTLEEWHVYNYLGPKHSLTSVGLLLGMSASYMGTMDTKMTKVLSVHVKMLLPPGSSDLNVNTLVQSVGIVGVGLVFFNRKHRKITQIMTEELTNVDSTAVSVLSKSTFNEAYYLCVGFALGLINIGNGNYFIEQSDNDLVRRLLSITTPANYSTNNLKLSKLTPGALMALALTFLRTGNKYIANKLDLNDSQYMIQYIRPDQMFLRILARNLILWDDIEGTMDWILVQIPKGLRSGFSQKLASEKLDSLDLPFFYAMAGAVFAMALKYNSQLNIEVRDIMLELLDRLIRLVRISSDLHDADIARNGLINVIGSIALAVSIVMAGSGDVLVMRRLRNLHGHPYSTYGGFMAVEMALGFLFLGGGQCQFCDSDIAIASLVMACYPLFPNVDGDSQASIEALRHIWALAVEKRCVVVRELETNKPCNVNLKFRAFGSGKTIDLRSPTLLPLKLHEISSIETLSDKYNPVVLDFSTDHDVLDSFSKSLTIFNSSETRVDKILEYVTENNKDIQSSSISASQTLGKLTSFLKFYEDDKLSIFPMHLVPSLRSNVADEVFCFEKTLEDSRDYKSLLSLKLLLLYADKYSGAMKYIPQKYIDHMRLKVNLAVLS